MRVYGWLTAGNEMHTEEHAELDSCRNLTGGALSEQALDEFAALA